MVLQVYFQHLLNVAFGIHKFATLNVVLLENMFALAEFHYGTTLFYSVF